MYAVLIHPSLRMVGQEDLATARRNANEKELNDLRNEYQQLQASISDYQRRLLELGGSPPKANQKDRQIARVTALAKECHVKVNQVAPIETVDQEDHQAVLLQFGGQASYRAARDFFRRVENEIDFVDVTNFSVSKVPQEVGSGECVVTWSCRINGMRPDEKGTDFGHRSDEAGGSQRS
jgi:hypothetical protein